jgi:hypothetical protein
MTDYLAEAGLLLLGCLLVAWGWAFQERRRNMGQQLSALRAEARTWGVSVPPGASTESLRALIREARSMAPVDNSPTAMAAFALRAQRKRREQLGSD